MSWTYSGDPSASDKDFVRFTIGDTDTTDQMVSDEEIAAALSATGDEPLKASVYLLEGLVARYSRKIDKSMGDISISYSQLVKNFSDLLRSVKARVATTLLPPYAGGISVSDKLTDQTDSDLVQPGFHVGMHDYE